MLGVYMTSKGEEIGLRCLIKIVRLSKYMRWNNTLIFIIHIYTQNADVIQVLGKIKAIKVM